MQKNEFCIDCWHAQAEALQEQLRLTAALVSQDALSVKAFKEDRAKWEECMGRAMAQLQEQQRHIGARCVQGGERCASPTVPETITLWLL